MSCCSIFKELLLRFPRSFISIPNHRTLVKAFFIFFQVFFALPFLSPPVESVSIIIQALLSLVNSKIGFFEFFFIRLCRILKTAIYIAIPALPTAARGLLSVCIYICGNHTSAAPRALQDATASSSGASLQITLSQARTAPVSLHVSSQLRIHSPSPQP